MPRLDDDLGPKVLDLRPDNVVEHGIGRADDNARYPVVMQDDVGGAPLDAYPSLTGTQSRTHVNEAVRRYQYLPLRFVGFAESPAH